MPYGGEAVNTMAFDADGHPTTDFEKAYLLNCTIEEVAEKEAAFKFNAIVPGETPTIEGDFNGTLTIWGATTLENGGAWAKDKPDAHCFKATLTRYAVGAEETFFRSVCVLSGCHPVTDF